MKLLNNKPFFNPEDVDILVIDCETYGLRWFLPDEGIFGIALTVISKSGVKSSYYADIRRDFWVIEFLRQNINKARLIINHNLKFDLHHLLTLGVEVDFSKCICTMINAALIDGTLNEYSLDSLGKRYLKEGKDGSIYDDLAKLFGGSATRKTQIEKLHKAPLELVSRYAIQDTELTYKLWKWQESKLTEEELLEVWNLERELFQVVFDMERRGVRVDVEAAHSAVVKLTRSIDEYQKALNDMAGFEVNPNPSDSIKKLFQPTKTHGVWTAIDGTILPSTPKGGPSIGTDVLTQMKHPAAQLILDCRKLLKCRDTFLKGHVLSYEYKGYVHPSINQTRTENASGTVTGRFSISEPAMQQIPSRDYKVASVVRPIFLPDEGHVWGSWDYSQFEFRMFAHYVQAPSLLKAYQDDPNTDFHGLVAKLTGLPRKPEDAKQGQGNAKQVNLGMVYGMGGGKLAQQMGLPYTVTKQFYIEEYGEKIEVSAEYAEANPDEITYVKSFMNAGEEAQRILSLYHEAIPGIKEFTKRVKSTAVSRGHIWSIARRKLKYAKGSPDTHKAFCHLNQGSSADCLKVKMIEIFKYLKNKDARLMLCVHDENNISFNPDERHIIKGITEIMETFDGVSCPIKLRVPIKTDYGEGRTWAEASGKGFGKD